MINILTCKIGNSTINCLDETYDRYRLKEWSRKGILKCPICNGDYEYCHGEIVAQYFRHVGKECDGYYYEQETDEHRQGKVLLYNWIKQQPGVSNCKLEHWIPETKQRPDIYFEFNGSRFVIEYQCSPIASEFLLRRELYKLAGISDIWILGTEKYNIKINEFGEPIHKDRYKAIEENLSNQILLYLNPYSKSVISNSPTLKIDEKLTKAIKKVTSKGNIQGFNLYSKFAFYNDFLFIEDLNHFQFDGEKFSLDDKLSALLNHVNKQYLDEYNRIISEEKALNERASKLKEKVIDLTESSSYVGIEGNDIDIKAVLMDRDYFRTYKSYLYMFLDEKGNVFVWMTSTCRISVGEYVELTGKVKSHDIYDGVKQTRIARCKIKNRK